VRLRGLQIRHERRKGPVLALRARGRNTFSTQTHTSRIVVVRIQPPGEEALEIDLAASNYATALLEAVAR